MADKIKIIVGYDGSESDLTSTDIQDAFNSGTIVFLWDTEHKVMLYPYGFDSDISCYKFSDILGDYDLLYVTLQGDITANPNTNPNSDPIK